MNPWTFQDPIKPPIDFSEKIGGAQLISETLVRRGYNSYQKALGFLDPTFYTPSSPNDLSGIDEAVDLLKTTIHDNARILVWGDFDVDGQTSTTLLISALNQLGANSIHYIPIRETESHGIQLARLSKFIQNENLSLLLTCDTGISANEPILYAKNHGLKVIITDHHQLPEELPSANSIINPKFLSENHKLASLPGVGVAYKLVEALFESSNNRNNLDQFLDLVALGIVADVAELTQDTRYLLQLGIKQLQKTNRVGLLALMEQAEIVSTNIDEELIAFGLAPRLNALGRLADANMIVDFLTTKDVTKARLAAIELEALNARRKLLTDQVFEGALDQIKRNPEISEAPAIILSHPSWPGGIIGIVASRIVDYFRKPTILISSPPGEIGRGSARSISGINITNAIAEQSDLLVGFGGHPMAAGFSIDPDNISAFKTNLFTTLHSQRQPDPERSSLIIDAWVNLKDLSNEFVQDINRLAPFGAGNLPLIFASSNLEITKKRLVGRNNEHWLVTVSDQNGYQSEVVWWQGSKYNLPSGIINLAFTIRATNYRGQPGIQIIWVDSQPINKPTPGQDVLIKDKPKIIDFRKIANPEELIRSFTNEPETLIWGEGLEAKSQIPGLVDRKSLKKTHRLIIWTIPPGIDELKEIIQQVDPREILFFANNPEVDEPEVFLNKLIGMLKYAVRDKAAIINVEDLACSIGQRTVLITTGLNWLVKKDFIALTPEKDNTFRVKLTFIKGKSLPIDRNLIYLLNESTAFRKYYLRADLNKILELDE